MILGFAPRFDEATGYSRKWFEKLAEHVNMHVTRPEEAVREVAEQLIAKLNPETIVFYNHGLEDSLIGNDGKPMVNMENISLLKGKTLYTMSCLSGRKLGVQHWRNNGVFWGYIEEFMFTIDEEELFMEAANHGLIVREKEKIPWSKCLEKAKTKFNELIARAKHFWTKVLLTHDRDALVCYDSTPPEEKCIIRKIASKMFRTAARKISRKFGVGLFLALIGWGVTTHAVASELYYKGGYAEILKLQGEYVGLGLTLIGIIMLASNHIAWLKTKS